MSDPKDRTHRERVYQGIFGAIEKTGDERPGMSAHELYYNRCDQAGLRLPKVKRAIRAAVENDELLRVYGPDGKMRYIPTEEETLRECVEWLADAEEPDREEIAKVNQALKQA